MTYKIYVYDKKKSWTLLAKLKNKNLTDTYIDLLSPLYDEIIAIRNNKSHHYDEVYMISNISGKKNKETKERNIFKNFDSPFYKVYGSTDKGWDYLGTLYEILDIDPFIQKLDSKIYNSCMVIGYNPVMRSDELYQLEIFDKNKSVTRKRALLEE